MLIFVSALFILFVSSLPWVAVSRPSNKPAWLMALYLIASANVTLSCYIANSFYLLNQRWVMLMLHIFFGCFGWLIWHRAGRPPLSISFQDLKTKFIISWLRREPVLALLMLGMIVSYTFALTQVILIPQNNMDSLNTHLARIGFWLQHGSFFPWETRMLNQVWYPVNAQLQIYWTLLFLGSDRMVGSAQWLAVLISGVGVFGMARLLGYRQRQSAFAALIFLSFPLVALQSTTTQTDLLTAAFFVPAVYFLILGMKENQYSLLTLSAISIGLGIGVKKSYFVLLPVVAVLALLVVLQYGRRTWKPLVFWSLNLLISVTLLGSYLYVVNWKYFGDPFGSPAFIDTLIDVPQSQSEAPKVEPGLARMSRRNPAHIIEANDSLLNNDIFLELIYNTPRLFYQALDTSGLPRPLDGYSHKVKMYSARALFKMIGFEEIEGTAFTAPGHAFSFTEKNVNEESHAWYGPLSVILILPALLLQSWRGLRRRDYLLLMPGVALLIFLPLEIIFRPGWDPFQGRYFAPLVALSAPFIAAWFKKEGNPIHVWLISALAVVIIVVTLLYNPAKPTLGKHAGMNNIWNNDRIFLQTIQAKRDRAVYYMVEEFVPADATLGYYIPFFFLEYPLFGENANRRLKPMVSASQISDVEWLRMQGIEYLLLPNSADIPLPAPGYRVIASDERWILYAHTPTP